MAGRLVVRSEKRQFWPGGLHSHVAAIVLDDGRRIEAEDARWGLEARTAAFSVAIPGGTADVRVERCPRCQLDHLATTADTPWRQRLVALPDAPTDEEP